MIYEINNSVNKTSLTTVKRVTLSQIGWKEKDLEDLISKNIQELIPENQLMILAQEKSGQEFADILALDEDGNLYIFELKRWESNKENLLQVLRYGQIFGQYDYEKLEGTYQKQNGRAGSSLLDDHYTYFSDSLVNKLKKSDFNRQQNFIVITDGADLDTLNAIKYWKNLGIKMESLPFRVFEIGGKYLFEFNKYNPKNDIILDTNTGYYIVNTNIAWSKFNYKEMLTEEKAAAYYDKKQSVDKIKIGDIVFLYQTGLGIIAFGKAISNYQIKDVEEAKGEEGKNEEHYVKLKFDWKIDPDLDPDNSIKAREINDILNTGHSFRQTCFSINEDMVKTIVDISKTK